MELYLSMQELLVNIDGYVIELANLKLLLPVLRSLVEAHHIHDLAALDHP